MPALDPRFVLCPPLQDFFIDKDTGFPLSGGVVTFYEDENRTVLKPVYQLAGSPNNYIYNELPNPLTLSSVGTFQDDTGNDIIPYLFPYEGIPTESTGGIELYYITVQSSGFVPQFVRQAWPNTIGEIAEEGFENTDNQLSNPQFVEVNFNNFSIPYVYTVSGTGTISNIAPDWDIVTNGAGTVSVKQIASVDTAIPSNPPYLLDITSTGINSLLLRQRLVHSPRLLANSFINGSFVAASIGAQANLLSMQYIPSNGAATQYTFFSLSTTPDDLFKVFNGTIDTSGLSINPDSPVTGYVDIEITIPVGAHIQISSVQIVGVEDINDTVEFLEQSTSRQIDHLFHYYNPALMFKPIPSYLVGWDFPLNPAQFTGSSVAPAISANQSAYVWDQTILYMSANSGINVNRSANGGIVVTSTSNCQGALIQYLDQTKVRELMENNLSVYVESAITSNNISVPVTVSLWYTKSPSLPNVATGTNLSIVSSLDSNGHPTTFNGTWIEIPRLDGLGNATFNATFNTTTMFNTNSFNKFNLATTTDISSATFFAIVVGTGVIPSGNNITFNCVALTPGDIPTRPAPQTADEVLRQCQYFYEKSYTPGVVPGTISFSGAQTSYINVNTYSGSAVYFDSLYLQSFSFNFKQIKRVTPNMTFYSPISATPGFVEAAIFSNSVPVSTAGGTGTNPNNYPIGNWTPAINTTGAVMFCSATTVNQVTISTVNSNKGDEGLLLYHYEANALLGII